MMALRPGSGEPRAPRGSILDSLGSHSSRPSSSGRRAQSAKSTSSLGLSGGSDALRRVMRQLTRDSMADKNLAENEAEDDYVDDEDTDLEDGNIAENHGQEGQSEDSAEKGHRHLHNGKYLSCKRYPWICLKGNCQHKKEFSGEYKAISDKNLKQGSVKDNMTQNR